MSATEVLAKVKALPANERAVFARLFHDWLNATKSENQGQTGRNGQPVQWPDFVERLRKNFPGGIPEGPSASQLIDEGRGDS